MDIHKSKPTDMEELVEELPKRDVLQIVPANDWQALCSEWKGDVLDMLSGRVDGWALVEERQPRMSMVVGVTYKYFWDELPEFRRYVHKSVSMKGLEPTPPGLPRRVVEREVRGLRIAGVMVTSEYPKFKLAIHDPSNPRLKPQILDPEDSDFDIKMRDFAEDRRIVAIMPATGASALFATAGNGERERQPIFVWALVQEPNGAYTVGGIDKEGFLCDEWTNFAGYEPEPPKPDEFQKTTFVDQAMTVGSC